MTQRSMNSRMAMSATECVYANLICTRVTTYSFTQVGTREIYHCVHVIDHVLDTLSPAESGLLWQNTETRISLSVWKASARFKALNIDISLSGQAIAL